MVAVCAGVQRQSPAGTKHSNESSGGLGVPSPGAAAAAAANTGAVAFDTGGLRHIYIDMNLVKFFIGMSVAQLCCCLLCLMQMCMCASSAVWWDFAGACKHTIAAQCSSVVIADTLWACLLCRRCRFEPRTASCCCNFWYWLKRWPGHWRAALCVQSS